MVVTYIHAISMDNQRASIAVRASITDSTSNTSDDLFGEQRQHLDDKRECSG